MLIIKFSKYSYLSKKYSYTKPSTNLIINCQDIICII